MTTPVWRNDDLEGAVIGAFFLRGADHEVMDILATLPADVFSVRAYRDIYTGICRQARVSGVIDPVLLCNEMPELAPVITDTGRKTWVKSSLEHYVAALRRNAALRDAEKTLNMDADGRIGPRTLNALRAYLKNRSRDGELVLVKAL
ncbi:DnaB-like helicase N-terminal domain-containing protein, partial [Escherichia coli]